MKSFFAKLFEFGGGLASSASSDLHDHVYLPVGFITLLVSLFVCLFYYKLLDKPTFHRWWHWLIVGGSTMLGMFFISWIYTISAFKAEDIDLAFTDYAGFLIAVCFYSFVFFFLFSLLFKNFSVNRHRTPF